MFALPCLQLEPSQGKGNDVLHSELQSCVRGVSSWGVAVRCRRPGGKRTGARGVLAAGLQSLRVRGVPALWCICKCVETEKQIQK